jgi:hypothetical protein
VYHTREGKFFLSAVVLFSSFKLAY